MKLIIAGSRDLEVNSNFLHSIVYMIQEDDSKIVTEIVSGGASGIDACAKRFSQDAFFVSSYLLHNYKEFPADWDTHGRAAGHIRNKQMAEYADALLLIWDGESKGSANMKKEMQKLKKPIYEVILRTENL